MRRCGFTFVAAAALPLVASSNCNSTDTCERLLRLGSKCVSGRCTNPFASGCLNKLLGSQKRVCNSEDSSNRTFCRESRLNYTEVRIAPANWESSIFVSWVMQILLSELANVPVTLETGDASAKFSFYDQDPQSFYYPQTGYNWDAIFESNRVGGNCIDSSRPCAHVLPEVWNGQESEYLEARSSGDIEPVEGNGMVGELSLYIPKFLAERDSSLVSFFGLRGTKNQQKLAETFKRPTTWGEYCRQVSPTNCSADEFAARSPLPEEESRYFVEDLYKGHFRSMDDQNCTLNPRTCRGYLVDSTCTWSGYTVAQLYWNNIFLKSDGPLEPNGGYPYSDQIEIWKAANATKSAVIMLWYRPDITRQVFRRSEGEFQTIILPEPTYECTRNRVNETARCSADLQQQRGLEKGACDYDPHALQKITASSLAQRIQKEPEASRSPALDLLRSLQVSNLAIEDMFNAWSDRDGGLNGYNAREAVCGWVAENIDLLGRYVPLGYPRRIQEEAQYSGGGTYAAYAVGAFVTVVVLLTAALTFRYRTERVVVCARPVFLSLILAGFFLVALGATIYPMEPSKASCVTKQWLVMLGYTLELVPLLVKVAAINKLFRKAERLLRFELSQRSLFAKVTVVTLLVIVYLIIWTVIDPPTRTEELVLKEAESGIVEVNVECASSSDVWMLVALGWNTLLLVCATVLAFQSRNIRQQEFNESRTLAVMVYSHFLFLVIMLTMYFMSSNFPASTVAVIASFLLSFDTLTALVIYFGSKFFIIFSEEAATNDRSSVRNSQKVSSLYGEGDNDMNSRCDLPNPPLHEDCWEDDNELTTENKETKDGATLSPREEDNIPLDTEEESPDEVDPFDGSSDFRSELNSPIFLPSVAVTSSNDPYKQLETHNKRCCDHLNLSAGDVQLSKSNSV